MIDEEQIKAEEEKIMNKGKTDEVYIISKGKTDEVYIIGKGKTDEVYIISKGKIDEVYIISKGKIDEVYIISKGKTDEVYIISKGKIDEESREGGEEEIRKKVGRVILRETYRSGRLRITEHKSAEKAQNFRSLDSLKRQRGD